LVKNHKLKNKKKSKSKIIKLKNYNHNLKNNFNILINSYKLILKLKMELISKPKRNKDIIKMYKIELKPLNKENNLI